MPQVNTAGPQTKTFPELRDRVRNAIRLCLQVSNNPQYRERIRRFAYEPSFVGMKLVTLLRNNNLRAELRGGLLKQQYQESFLNHQDAS